MRFLLLANLSFGLLLLCTSCSNKQYQSLFESRDKMGDTALQRPAVTLNDYHIKPQDVLQIRNLQSIQYIVDQAPATLGGTSNSSTAQGQTYQVEEDGTVALPVIGRVQVVGLTRSEAQKTIEDIYKKKLLVNPIIDLKIINLKVTILGEIKLQGNYPLVKDRTTLVELIGEAGGLTDRANERTIKIIRGGDKNPQVTIIDLNDIRSINEPDAVLQSGDIVYIAQNRRAVRNDNLQSFSTLIQPALILFNTALIIFTLVRK